MKRAPCKYLPIILCTVVILSIPVVSTYAQTDEVKGVFLYNLSSFQGEISFGWVRISVDREANEIFAISRGVIRIFNHKGMQTYSFGQEEIGHIFDMAVAEDGSILFLTNESGGQYSVVRCNFRGVPTSEIAVFELPSKFSDFKPDRIFYRRGQIYLVDSNLMLIAITDADGRYVNGYDLIDLLGEDESKRGDLGLNGFCVDGEGNMLFTIAVKFKAYRLLPDGKIQSFGKAGSIPGRFNVVSGIESDGRGNILVVDTLRSVVMVFSEKDFRFKTEFGYRGLGPGQLIAPNGIVADGKGKIYISQSMRRGISVFRLEQVTPENTNGVIQDLKGGDREKTKQHTTIEEVTAVSYLRDELRSSVKGKPAVRRGHKAHGSTGGDGRAAGEKEGGSR